MTNTTNKITSALSAPSLSTFLEQKKESLTTDKSFKSSWDAPILQLLSYINEHQDMYSASSCSGRISMMVYEGNQDETTSVQKKYDATFGFVSHETVETEAQWADIQNLIQRAIKQKETIWFQQEPVIIHIRTKTVEQAMDFVHLFHTWGYKRSGLCTIKNQKFLIWVASTEEMKTPIVKNGKYLISDDYLDLLVSEANKRLKQTHRKIYRAEVGLLQYFLEQFTGIMLDFWFGPVKRNKRKETPAPVCKQEVIRNKLMNRWVLLSREDKSRFEEWPSFPISNMFICDTITNFVLNSTNTKIDKQHYLSLVIYLDQYARYHVNNSNSENQIDDLDKILMSSTLLENNLDQLLQTVDSEKIKIEYVPIEQLFFYVAATRSTDEQVKKFGLDGIQNLVDPEGEYFVFSKDREDIFAAFLQSE